MEKVKLNSLVVAYKETGEETLFTKIYEEVIGFDSVKYDKIGKSIVASGHEAIALYEDTLLNCIEKYNGETDFENLYKLSVKRKRINLYEKSKNRARKEDYSVNREDENAATFEIVDDFDLEEAVISKKKNDQRQLIEFLVNGENERTTAIVQAYLSTDLKTPTAIGNHLGLDHKQVSRALNRLAAKFSTKQYGDYHDYLVAL